MNSNGANSQFTLTCISGFTAGPATTITWTRDSNLVAQGKLANISLRDIYVESNLYILLHKCRVIL